MDSFAFSSSSSLSMFDMMINEIASNVMKKDVSILETFATKLAGKIRSMSAGRMQKLKLSKKIACLELPDTSPNHTFQFCPPTTIVQNRNAACGIHIMPAGVIDLVIIMPAACFGKRDFMNYIYLKKKLLYMQHLAKQIRKLGSVAECHYVADKVNPFLIKLRVSAKDIKWGAVVISTALPDIYKPSRCSPDVANIRKKFDDAVGKDELNPDLYNPDVTIPTPYYNQAILEDMLISKMCSPERTTSLRGSINNNKGFLHGIVLIRVWMKSRCLDSDFGGISSHLLNIMLVHLLSNKTLNPLLPAAEIFAVVLRFFAETDFSSPLRLTTGQLQGGGAMHLAPSESIFSENFECSILDSTGCLNFGTYFQPTFIDRLKFESAAYLEHLSTGSLENFSAAFMQPFRRCLNYDVLVIVIVKDVVMADCVNENFHRRYALIVSKLVALIRRAVGQRIVCVHCLDKTKVEWLHDDSRPLDKGEVKLALKLDLENCSSILDKGPIANSNEAEDFRRFWGELSELRKFSDGVVREAVVWPGTTVRERRRIVPNIIQYILKRHLSIPPENITFNCNLLDGFLQPRNSNCLSSREEEFSDLRLAFDKLNQMIRNLDGLPLSVTNIQSPSPAVRKCQPFPVTKWSGDSHASAVYEQGRYLVPRPSALFSPDFHQSVEVQIILEGSGQWPDVVAAVRRLKAACYLKIAEAMREQCGLVAAGQQNCAIVMLEGYAFRLRLVYPREVALLKRTVLASGLQVSQNTDESDLLELETEKKPQLATALDGWCQQFPILPGTCRLAKRWLSAHLLDRHVPEMAIELIVASVFLNPCPYSSPGSYQCGFMQLLDRLVSHNWLTAPLMVDLNHSFTAVKIREIHNLFISVRPTLPFMTICTPFDLQGSYWTKEKPTGPVLDRLIRLAKATLEKLESVIMIPSSFDVLSLLRTPLSVFDVLLHLSPLHNTRKGEHFDFQPDVKKSKVGTTDHSKLIPVLDYDPIELLLDDLEASFGSAALFCRDSCGGTVIGMLWKPEAFLPVPATLDKLQGRTMVSVEGEHKMQFSKDVVLDEIRIIGRGMIADVILQTD